MSRFLRFVVEQTLEGNADRIKEYTIGMDVFGRSADYDPAADSTVRSEASKLRAKLNTYYLAEGKGDPLSITIPKGTYVPVFVERPTLRRSNRTFIPAIVVAGASVLVAFAISLVVGQGPKEWHPLPLTRLPGFELEPSLSPDGNQVAFAWTGSANPGPQDIWIKAVGGEALKRLTNTPESEMSPSWSPDGREIAFVRANRAVFIASQVDGSERKVADSGAIKVRWAPDGRSVLFRDRIAGPTHAVFQVNVKTLEKRQLTYPSSGMGDWLFAVSPDGSTLAFIRYRRAGIADLFVMPMRGGDPRRLTDWNRSMDGLEWSPDGREIIYAVAEGAYSRLWRIPANHSGLGRGSPIALPMSGDQPSRSLHSPAGVARLAFRTGSADISLRIIDLHAPLAEGMIRSIKPVCDSTSVDQPGTFSFDGSRIAFVSDRTGRTQLWIANNDGSGLRQLTHLDSPSIAAPSWSPDARQIAFEATVSGNTDVYVIPSGGGEPKRLTSDDSAESAPSWSRDGRWIYFSSDKSGRHEIWKLPASGGEPFQLTRSGGSEPRESHKGDILYFLDRVPIAPELARLKKLVLDTGVESVVVEGLRSGHWSVTGNGIVFVAKDGPGWLNDVIDAYDSSKGEVTRIGRLPFRIPPMNHLGWLTVSADGRWALTNQVDRWEFDLMLIDGFR